MYVLTWYDKNHVSSQVHAHTPCLVYRCHMWQCLPNMAGEIWKRATMVYSCVFSISGPTETPSTSALLSPINIYALFASHTIILVIPYATDSVKKARTDSTLFVSGLLLWFCVILLICWLHALFCCSAIEFLWSVLIGVLRWVAACLLPCVLITVYVKPTATMRVWFKMSRVQAVTSVQGRLLFKTLWYIHVLQCDCCWDWWVTN